MSVFLVRHSYAVDEAADLVDEHRFLSERGREVARRVGDVLRERGIRFTAIATSPLVRAVQTAELLAQAVGYRGTVLALPALAPSMSVRRAAEEIAALGDDVACVGHEPNISALAATLCAAPSAPSFRPCQVVRVENGAVAWTLSPDALASQK